MENETDNLNPAVRDASEKCTAVHQRNVGDQRKLNSFHRRQLRKVIGIQWPHKISNNKLYKITRTKPLSITMAERRWKLLRHTLRLPADCLARKTMRYFFEERTSKILRGRRTITVSTLNEDIKRTTQDDTVQPR